jgi:hypothetical protein
MCSVAKFSAYLLLLLATVVNSSPLYFYPQKEAFDSYNGEAIGAIHRIERLPWLYNKVYYGPVRYIHKFTPFFSIIGSSNQNAILQ